jgi:mucin-19
MARMASAGTASGIGVIIQSGAGVLISGQHVFVESGVNVISIANISGQAVTVSGNVVIAKISGETVTIAGGVSVSGDIVQISGQHVFVESGVFVISAATADISGQAVTISGNVVIAKISGETVTLAGGVSVSGNIVQISGQHVFVESGVLVVIQSGASVISAANISGQAVTVSGNTVIAKISGETVTIAGGVSISGNIVQISGQIVGANIISGQFTLDANQLSNVAAASGVVLKNIQGSGNQLLTTVAMGLNYFTNPNAPKYIALNVDNEGCTYVTTHSGEYVGISGTVTVNSGTGVIVQSGIGVQVRSGTGVVIQSGASVISAANIPTLVQTGSILRVTGLSGGIAISSGIVVSAVVKAVAGNSGDIYVGGSGAARNPYSGYGYLLRPGEAYGTDINNLFSVKVVASISGDMITFAGVG